MKTTEIKVEGMSCINCAANIKRYLENQGMDEVNVDFASGEVQFVSGKRSQSLEEVKKGIRKLGYRVAESEQSELFWTLERKVFLGSVFTIPLIFQHLFAALGGPVFGVLDNPWIQFFLCLPVYLLGFFHFGRSAWSSVKTGVPNMDVLIFMGSTAAFVYSVAGLSMMEPDYIFFETSATIITIVLIGNLLEHRAVKRTTSAIDELSRLQPLKARKIMPSGILETIDVEEVKTGDKLQVNDGDQIPADGIVLKGKAWVDESVITGESAPVGKQAGQSVIAGALVTKGNFQLQVTATGRAAFLGQMIDLVKAAGQRKPKIQRLSDKISAVFVPLVVGIAVLTFVLSWTLFNISFTQALMNSIAVLVISCPCAMGLATPTAVMAGVGRLAKSGVLVKGGDTIETLAGIRNFVFDKTGTLTTGDFTIRNIDYHTEDVAFARSLLLEMEKHSSHPIAGSLIRHLNGDGVENGLFNSLKINEVKGLGVFGKDSDGNTYAVGSYSTAEKTTEDNSHDLYLTKGDNLLATIDLEDQMVPGLEKMMKYLGDSGYRVVILSGDKKKKVRDTAGYLGVSEFHAEQMPGDKLKIIDRLSQEQPTAMIGDGVNDAPALARADLGISLSGASNVSIQSAQVIMLNKQLATLPRALEISKNTLLTIKQNLFWAFAYNIVAIPLAAVGMLNPMWAAFFMAFSDVVVVGNSLRLKMKKIKT